jgi:outer membrane protein assembly factor BamD (BamD/ComL family)
MKKVIVFSLVIFLGSSLVPAQAFWIWTPKTQKWVNPKKDPKSNPKEQFEFAKSFYAEKKYEEAKREFKKLLDAFPKSVEAAESQYYLGLIAEAQDDLYEAYLAYQKVIDKYPFSERIQQIIEREYKIAEAFMSGKKRKALGIVLPVDNPAIEIFTKVVENSTYGPLAPAAQYKLGLVLKGLMRYYEAEEAFNKLITNYPKSEWVTPAKFQLAACRAAVSRGTEYDQGAAEEAKEKFEEFLKQHPDAVLSRDAQANIAQLREKEAESSYDIGRFYEKQKQYDSAKIYYNEVVVNYPDNPWAAKALERLRVMEKEKR